MPEKNRSKFEEEAKKLKTKNQAQKISRYLDQLNQLEKQDKKEY
jgi:hypothetical protein